MVCLSDKRVSVCRFAVAMHAFLQAVCGDVLACVWKLCAPPGATPGGQGAPGQAAVSQSEAAHELHTLTAQVRHLVTSFFFFFLSSAGVGG